MFISQKYFTEVEVLIDRSRNPKVIEDYVKRKLGRGIDRTVIGISETMLIADDNGKPLLSIEYEWCNDRISYATGSLEMRLDGIQ